MADFHSRLGFTAVLVGSLLYCSNQVLADENVADQNAVAQNVDQNIASGALPETAPSMFGTTAVSQDALEAFRGGTEVLNISKNDGVVGNNQAYNLTTGSNIIADGSLAGASGFSTVIQNSGNNVLIQNSTNINLQVK